MNHTTLLRIGLATAAVALAAACTIRPTPTPPAAAPAPAGAAPGLQLVGTEALSPREAADLVRPLDDSQRDVLDRLEAAGRVRPQASYPMPSVADAIVAVRAAGEAP